MFRDDWFLDNGEEDAIQVKTQTFLEHISAFHAPFCELLREEKRFEANDVVNLAIAGAASLTLSSSLKSSGMPAHHCHSCTLNDVVSLGATKVVVSLREPASRIQSGLSRKVELFHNWCLQDNGTSTPTHLLTPEHASKCAFTSHYCHAVGGYDKLIENLETYRHNEYMDKRSNQQKDVDDHVHPSKYQLELLRHNYFIPVVGFYLKGWKKLNITASRVWTNGKEYVEVEFLCQHTLVEDVARIGSNFGFNWTLNPGQSKHISKKKVELPPHLVPKLQQIYREDYELFKQECSQHSSANGTVTEHVWMGDVSDLDAIVAKKSIASGNNYTPEMSVGWLSKTLGVKFGVLHSAAGDEDFLKRDVLPAVEHYREFLQIPDAAVRAAHRASGDFSNGADTGFALVAQQYMIDGPLNGVLSFFDSVVAAETLVDYPKGWLVTPSEEEGERRNFAKSVKVHSFTHAPFNISIFMDFDTRPCTVAFAEELTEYLGESDIAMSNKWPKMYAINDRRHWNGEHASSLVVMNMESVRTQKLIWTYVVAFSYFPPTFGLDQPALRIALELLSHLDVGSNFTRQHGPVRHTDLPGTIYCRKNISENMQCRRLMGGSCLLIHKLQQFSIENKVFGIGMKKTGTTTLHTMFQELANRKQSNQKRAEQLLCPERERVAALNDLLFNNTLESALTLSDKHVYFQDGPWCSASSLLYQKLASRHPFAVFVLTIRNSTEWWHSVEAWVHGKTHYQNPKNDMRVRYSSLFGAKSFQKEDMITSYEAYNQGVQRFFKDEIKQPSRLLTIDLTDPLLKSGRGWSLLCSFIENYKGSTCPAGATLPHKNPTPEKFKIYLASMSATTGKFQST